MQDFRKLYQEKLTTVEGAAALLESGMTIAADICVAHPSSLYRAVADRVKKGELKNMTSHVLLEPEEYPFMTDPEVAENYRGVTWFSGGHSRKAVNSGLMDVMPCYYRDVPELFSDYVKPEVYCAVVSPMDEHGYFTSGCDHSISDALLDSAKLVLLQVNRNMPRSFGSTLIHVSQVDALWEEDSKLYEIPLSEPDEVGKKISEYIIPEIPDGATLQLGIGGIPDAVALGLKDHKHLGCHTEMFTNSMLELIECGAVDNTEKVIDRGKSVATFAVGTRKMYDFIDNNPAFQLMPVNYVNDPNVICKFPNFISINAAIEVDFFGQVCAEAVGHQHVSGTGGQVDFVRGAVQSKGGKSFIAFPSTAAHGKVSRIVPSLTQGAPVSTGKNDVDYVVTEYGIAALRGHTVGQRTKQLIAIAAPQFRDELTFEAKKLNIII